MENKPKLSDKMTDLYGNDAQAVYDRCQTLDPVFNQFVQEVVYDWVWNLPPLNLQEKSLITVVSLVVLDKTEQMEIHLKGFLNSAGTTGKVDKILQRLLTSQHIRSRKAADVTFKRLMQEKNLTLTAAKDLTLREIALIELAARMAKGDQEKTTEYLEELLTTNALSSEEIKAVMRQQMIYCGCPCTMNGFAALASVQKN